MRSEHDKEFISMSHSPLMCKDIPIQEVLESKLELEHVIAQDEGIDGAERANVGVHDMVHRY